LLSSPLENLPILLVLTLFFVVFSVFSFVFCWRWFSARKKLERGTVAAARVGHEKVEIPFEPTRRSQ
jgi:membrane protein implicated in regulation of membrane protease activity